MDGWERVKERGPGGPGDEGTSGAWAGHVSVGRPESLLVLSYQVPLAACGACVRVAPGAGVGRAVPGVVLNAIVGAAHLPCLCIPRHGNTRARCLVMAEQAVGLDVQINAFPFAVVPW